MNPEELKTPYFMVDKHVLDELLGALKESLQAAWGNYIIGYSTKTNSLPWIIKYLTDEGCYAEVVSDDEYNLVKTLSVDEKHIVYNGVAKDKETFLEAIRNHAIVNIDSEYEIDWLDDLGVYSTTDNYEKKFEVGIRVNFDMESRCPGHDKHPEDGSRFGFYYENGELLKAIDRIQSKGIRVVGIHFNRNSKTRMPEVYKTIAEVAVEISQKTNIEFSYIDIGGGYFGGMKNKPQFPDYFNLVSEILKKQFKPEKTVLIVEPGNALIASPIDYVTTVKDIKRTDKATYVVTDGSRVHIDPFMTKNSYFNEFDYVTDKKRKKIERQIISGYTCMESDRLFEVIKDKELRVGDHITYHMVGAYTMCFNSLFIKWFPNVYLKSGNEFYQLRQSWTSSEYFAKVLWEDFGRK